MEGIQVSVEKVGPQGEISIIRVGGYIDTTTSSELERTLDSLLKTGVVNIIIDLGKVDYISSAGWGIFISEIKGIRERGGDLKLAQMIPDVYEVFELLEFNYILKSYDTVEEALADFGIKESTGALGKGKSEAGPEKKEFAPEKMIEEAIPEALEEKIRMIALQHPSWGPGQIAKELNTEKFDFTRVGALTVWKILRKLNLASKKQREKIARMR